MRRQVNFFSDSDASDDDFALRPRAGPSSNSTRASETTFDDPLFSRAAAAAPSEDSTQASSHRSSADAEGLPQPSKVTATRRNLSHLFGGGPSPVPSSVAVGGAPLNAPAGTSPSPSHVRIDAAIQSTFSPSSLGAAGYAASTAAKGASGGGVADPRFAPRFTYEGPGSGGSRGDKLWSGEGSSMGDGRAGGLTTALHAVVQAYRATLSCGTCMLALCVPPTATVTNSSSSGSHKGNCADGSRDGAASTMTVSSVQQQQEQHLPPSAAARERLHQQQQQQQQQQQMPPFSSSVSSSSPSTHAGSSSPVLLLMSANQQILCRIPLGHPEDVFNGGALQLQQDPRRPQHLKFFYAGPSTSTSSSTPQSSSSHPFSASASSALPSSSSPSSPITTAAGCWWSCMFPDREKASEFLVATYTVAQYAAALARRAGTLTTSVPTVRTLPQSLPLARTASASSSVGGRAAGHRTGHGKVYGGQDAANVHDDDALSGSGVENRDGEDGNECVRKGVPATLSWRTWTLRRVSRTTPYTLPAECVDAADARDVTPGAGALRDGVEAASIGMRRGESRLVFMTPEETRVRHPERTSPAPAPQDDDEEEEEDDEGGAGLVARSRGGHAHRSNKHGKTHQHRGNSSSSNSISAGPLVLDRPAVAYITCVEAVSSTSSVAHRLIRPSSQRQASTTAPAEPPTAASVDSANGAGALLQQLLLQTLQQQQQQQQPPSSTQPPPLPLTAPNAGADTNAGNGGASGQRWDTVERSLDRVMLQLGSLYEKIDRLDIDGKLQRNNAALEQAMKRVVGLAPQDDIAAEDTLKDRDALLASIERYRHQYEEANTNYQRALEAMGRTTERCQSLEKDLQVQQDLWTRQRTDAAEQTRLKLLEKEVRHRDELERVAEERYAAGRSDGHAAGYREGRQAALAAVDGEGGVSAVMTEWKAKVTARDQQIVALQTALQDAKFHHERDRRQLRAEIDVLASLNEKLHHLQANADVRMPEETTQQQCKRVKRVLNTVYAQVEAQVLTLPSKRWDNTSTNPGGDDEAGETAVGVNDVLAVVMSVIKSEAQAAVSQIKADGERRARDNAELRALTLARETAQRPTSAYAYNAVPALHDREKWKGVAGAPAAQEEEQQLQQQQRGSDAALRLRSGDALQAATVHSTLAEVAASLLPAVAEATADVSAIDNATVPVDSLSTATDAPSGKGSLLTNIASENEKADDAQRENAASLPAASSRAVDDADAFFPQPHTTSVSPSLPSQRFTGSVESAMWPSPGVADAHEVQPSCDDVRRTQVAAAAASAPETSNMTPAAQSGRESANNEEANRVDASTRSTQIATRATRLSGEHTTSGELINSNNSNIDSNNAPSPLPSPISVSTSARPSYEDAEQDAASSSPYAGRPTRQATRLPELPEPLQSSEPHFEDDDSNAKADCSPSELTRGAVQLPETGAPSPSGSAQYASPISGAEDTTPLVRDVQGIRLFATPSSPAQTPLGGNQLT